MVFHFGIDRDCQIILCVFLVIFTIATSQLTSTQSAINSENDTTLLSKVQETVVKTTTKVYDSFLNSTTIHAGNFGDLIANRLNQELVKVFADSATDTLPTPSPCPKTTRCTKVSPLSLEDWQQLTDDAVKFMTVFASYHSFKLVLYNPTEDIRPSALAPLAKRRYYYYSLITRPVGEIFLTLRSNVTIDSQYDQSAIQRIEATCFSGGNRISVILETNPLAGQKRGVSFLKQFDGYEFFPSVPLIDENIIYQSFREGRYYMPPKLVEYSKTKEMPVLHLSTTFGHDGETTLSIVRISSREYGRTSLQNLNLNVTSADGYQIFRPLGYFQFFDHRFE